MLVRWTQPAADDLLHICDYTAERFGAAQARRVADSLYETATSLQDMPNRGRKGRKLDTAGNAYLRLPVRHYSLQPFNIGLSAPVESIQKKIPFSNMIKYIIAFKPPGAGDIRS